MQLMKKCCLLAIAVTALASATLADTFPSKMVRIITPAPAGGMTDSTMRLLATELARMWGQQVIVDNRPGATGLISQQAVMNSSPDGHVLGMHLSGFITVLPIAHGPKYSVLTGTTPLAFVSEYPLVLATSAKSPYNDWKEYASFIAASGKSATYGTSGIGSTPHLTGERIKRITNVPMQDVPYKGDAPMIVDIVGGQVSIGMPIIGSALPMLKSGQLKGIAVTSAKRVPFAPTIPTLKEQGVDLVSAPWSLMIGPPGMDPKVAERIHRDLNSAMKSQALKDFFTTNALVWLDMTEEQLRAKIKVDTEAGQSIIRELKIPVN